MEAFSRMIKKEGIRVCAPGHHGGGATIAVSPKVPSLELYLVMTEGKINLSLLNHFYLVGFSLWRATCLRSPDNQGVDS